MKSPLQFQIHWFLSFLLIICQIWASLTRFIEFLYALNYYRGLLITYNMICCHWVGFHFEGWFSVVSEFLAQTDWLTMLSTVTSRILNICTVSRSCLCTHLGICLMHLENLSNASSTNSFLIFDLSHQTRYEFQIPVFSLAILRRLWIIRFRIVKVFCNNGI